MDYDPEWMHGDDDFMGGDDDFGSENRDLDHTEYDDLGNPVFLAASAGFGYHMSQDERDSLEEGLEEEERVEKIPLSARHSKIKGGSPFERWVRDVQDGRKKITDPLEYTPEEEKLILANEVVEE